MERGRWIQSIGGILFFLGLSSEMIAEPVKDAKSATRPRQSIWKVTKMRPGGLRKILLEKPVTLKPQKTVITHHLGIPEVVEATKAMKVVPDGYELKNVPGDGLCGYWAVLVAKKVRDQERLREIFVSKQEVKDLLKQLSDYIAYVDGRKEQSEEERSALEEINTLIENGNYKNLNDFLNRLEAGLVELDSPLLVFLARRIGMGIQVKKDEVYKGKRLVIHHEYEANGVEAGEGYLQLFYKGNGAGGHYQAILPKGKVIRFR